MEDVAQKLQPSGQPTDGISVAAISPGLVDWYAQDARVDARQDSWVVDRTAFILAQESAHPTHTLSIDDVVGVYQCVQFRNVGDVPADDNGGRGQVLGHPVNDALNQLDALRRLLSTVHRSRRPTAWGSCFMVGPHEQVLSPGNADRRPPP